MDKDYIINFLNSKLDKEAIDYYWANTKKVKSNDDLEISLKEIVLNNYAEMLNKQEITTCKDNFTNHIYTSNLNNDEQLDVVFDLMVNEQIQISLSRNPIYTTYNALKKVLVNFINNNEKRYNISNILVGDMSDTDIAKYNKIYNHDRQLTEREIKILILKENEHLLSHEEAYFYKEMLKQQLDLYKRSKEEVLEAIYNDYNPIDLTGAYIYSLVFDSYIHTQEEVSAKYRIKTLMANKHMFSDEEYQYHFIILNNELIISAENKKTFIK
jgi:hypothetical protein